MPQNKPLTPAERAAARERCEKAKELVSALCQPRGTKGSREWIMSIPARPDHDPDLVIADSLKDVPRALDDLDRLWPLIERMAKTHEAGCASFGISDVRGPEGWLNEACNCLAAQARAEVEGRGV